MSYKRYHTALVFSIVLQVLLKDTDLEYKALYLYADIIELENIPTYHIQTANKQAKRILKAIDGDEIKLPSPFTVLQRIQQKWRKTIIWMKNLHQNR
ncbi:hypothetical protein [Streptococcus gallolyticus]|uniref:hypothetical protein n=1 Tax=Streptococcus gallolyticus TaxID=315405 RepID=UPI002283E1BB|nr:hypothetical protein [Streptococcus gallolyticus]MCY7179253.1 hypothetical protein [Streptococcus gallolyticus subsp. gallolyticus]